MFLSAELVDDLAAMVDRSFFLFVELLAGMLVVVVADEEETAVGCLIRSSAEGSGFCLGRSPNAKLDDGSEEAAAAAGDGEAVVEAVVVTALL